MALLPNLIASPLSGLTPQSIPAVFVETLTTALNSYYDLLLSSLGGRPEPASMLVAKNSLSSSLNDILSQPNEASVAASRIGNALQTSFLSLIILGGSHGFGQHTSAGLPLLISDLTELFSGVQDSTSFASKFSKIIDTFVKTAMTTGSGVSPAPPDIGNFV